MLNETFGRRLRRLREEQGYSRREVGEGAGLSESAVRDYEQERRDPSLAAALRLGIALGLPAGGWEGLDSLTVGAYRLPPAKKAAQPHLVLTFGRHKGEYPEEVPTPYLEWLCRERPRQLSKELLQRVRDVRAQRRRQLDAISADIAKEEATSRRAVRIAEAEARKKEAEASRAEAAEAEERLRLQRLREREERVTPPTPSKTVKPSIDDAMPWERDGEPPDESRPEQ